MKRLVSSDLENFDGPYSALLRRLHSRREEIGARLRQIETQLLDGNLNGSSEHNRVIGNRCIPLVDDYVVVFELEEWHEGGETARHLYLLALEVEKPRH